MEELYIELIGECLKLDRTYSLPEVLVAIGVTRSLTEIGVSRDEVVGVTGALRLQGWSREFAGDSLKGNRRLLWQHVSNGMNGEALAGAAHGMSLEKG